MASSCPSPAPASHPISRTTRKPVAASAAPSVLRLAVGPQCAIEWLRGPPRRVRACWGLYNLVGNAQEWVKTQQGWNARGGAFSDPVSRCAPALSRGSDGAADATTGFRVVREIG